MPYAYGRPWTAGTWDQSAIDLVQEIGNPSPQSPMTNG